jgi:hypothetical protein
MRLGFCNNNEKQSVKRLTENKIEPSGGATGVNLNSTLVWGTRERRASKFT